MKIGDILAESQKVDSYVLERIDFHTQQKLDLGRVYADSTLDSFSNRMVYRLRTYIYGRESQKIIVYPKTWFQHLKETVYSQFNFMDKWFAEKYPVEYTEEVVTAQMLFPEIRTADNDKYTRVYAIKTDF